MKLLAIIATAACGLAAAFALTLAPTARAFDIHALPAGYTTDHVVQTTNVCPDSYYIFGYGKTSPQICLDSPSFQADVDSFVAATCPVAVCPPPTPTAATTDTTVAASPPPPPTPPIATDTTQTVTVTIVDPTIDARLTALEAQYAALAARVDAVAKANTASWDAFSASLASGASVADAALAARSAGMNAVYQLG